VFADTDFIYHLLGQSSTDDNVKHVNQLAFTFTNALAYADGLSLVLKKIFL